MSLFVVNQILSCLEIEVSFKKISNTEDDDKNYFYPKEDEFLKEVEKNFKI